MPIGCSMMMLATLILLVVGSTAFPTEHHSTNLDASCSGYNVSDIVVDGSRIQAQLDLVGKGCGIYGPDVRHLKLLVDYQGRDRLHVLIEDRDEERYRVPSQVFSRPSSKPLASALDSLFSIDLKESSGAFAFQVTRRDTGDVVFDTSNTSLVFERQFLRLKTWLPENPNLYGLGEHSDPLRLKSENYTRTLWNRDAGFVPGGENLYGSHPIYFDHRAGGTHGVLLMNSNGMDIVIDREKDGRQYLEYRVIGGVLDFYFFAGPDPKDVARQYAELVSKPAMVPYWSLGFHQCKYGYRDWFEVAEVVHNYSQANIPLEVMWTDIDYMNHRLIFTLDQGNFPIERMQDLTEYIHNRQQRYILMVDPAVGRQDYHAYRRGLEMNIFMKRNNGSLFEGVVWPGVAVFPDWFHPNATAYWVDMFENMFDPNNGIDIDGAWIDMNEPASFCLFPCDDPEGQAADRNLPPESPATRKPPRSIPGFPSHSDTAIEVESRRGWSDLASSANSEQLQLNQPPYRPEVNHEIDDLVFPPYRINNHVGELGEQTMHTNLQHANGLWTYDTHNLYGALMSMATRTAMLARRPAVKPFIVTRSTFAGSGKAVAKWLGDNASTWHHYRISIRGMLGFASIYQQPMVGSDVCGFIGDAKEKLCARWTTLGAFMPFFRNHADAGSVHQEFYRWPLVADAARYAINMRYRLLDYLYTALQRQSDDGTPAINPLWFLHPRDESTFAIDEQYYFGDCILVSPVLKEDSATVSMYLPDNIFYDLETHKSVRGHGEWIEQHNIPFDRIPLHIRGGCVLPLRVESANTTTELRKKGFEIIVAPDLDDKAQGSLYLDDGESLDGGEGKTYVEWLYEAGQLTTIVGKGFASLEEAGVKIEKVTILGHDKNEKGLGGGDEL